MNMITIIFLSIASLMVIVAEIFLFSQGGFNPAVLIYGRRAHFIIPEKNNFTVGSEFYFDLNASALTTPINVVQADITFDSDLLEVRSIDTANSFATIFTQKEYSNEEGWIRVVGGLPNPGYLGEMGQFVRIFFLPKSTGLGKITFLPTSKMLANDGKGTNILAKFPTSSIAIVPEKAVLGEETEINLIDKISSYLKTFLDRQ